MGDFCFWRWPTRQDDELDRELEVHVILEIEEQLDAGVPLGEAKLAAHPAFGSVALTKEQLRAMRTGARLDPIGRELRHAVRRLVRTPAFSLATMLTLALAIAANVAMFAVVYRVVLNPLPYGDSARLVALDFSIPDRNIRSGVPMTLTLYYQYVDRARTLDGVAVYRSDERTLTGYGVPNRVRVSRTTSSMASVLRVTPNHGRWFNDAEGAPGASQVAVVSHGLWVGRYGQNPGILGQQVTLDGVPTTVIGVMPASFAFPDPRVDVWIPDPISRAIAASPAAAGVYDYAGVARLRAGATIADARAELTRLAVDLAPANPGAGYDRLTSNATTLIDATVGRIAATLWILLASVALVLLVACANVANLFLVRSDAKQREIAVRRALGAGFGEIAGYFLAEGAWLAASGGTLGMMLAWGAVHLLVALGPSSLPRLEEVRLDVVAFAVTAALSVVAGLVCGSIPLVRLRPLAMSLHESGRSTTASRGRHRVRQCLMAGQVALALVLLVSSGLMLRSFQKLRAIDPGFDVSSALTFRVGLPPADYAARETILAAHRAILDRLSALPGVTAVSAATCLPLSEQGCFAGPLFVERRPLPPGASPTLVRVSAVADRYFDAMGTRVLAGRAIDRTDIDRNEAVAVVNQALVNIAFPRQDPIGQRVRLGNPAFSTNPGWLTIAGVVANTSYRALAEPTPVPMMYVPMLAARVGNISPPLGAMSYVVRSVAAPQTITEPARRTILDFDVNLAIAQVRTLQDILDRASSQMAFAMILLVLAASVALLLGMIGVYGVMAYIVNQRTGEIGVRLALGATPGGVVAMIVREGGLVAFLGITVGLALAFAGSRFIESLLYGISPRDPAVFGITATSLLMIALFACWMPARRAALLNPFDALRTD